MTKLSKKICKRCLNEFARRYGSNMLAWDSNNSLLWREDGSTICCAKKYRVIPINKIPDCCRYKLEHIVLSEKSK